MTGGKTMEAKGSTFLKVTGILMIVFGAIALVVSIIAILGIAALAAFNDGTYDMTCLLYTSPNQRDS